MLTPSAPKAPFASPTTTTLDPAGRNSRAMEVNSLSYITLEEAPKPTTLATGMLMAPTYASRLNVLAGRTSTYR
eukprot:scaffold544623_cov22-Prasinocladus_malaysianus.AAC.1